MPEDSGGVLVVVSVLGLAQVVWLAVISYLARTVSELAKSVSNLRDRLGHIEGQMCVHYPGNNKSRAGGEE